MSASISLPAVASLEEYRALYRQEALWPPVMEEIAQRHGRAGVHLRRVRQGTHIVFFAGHWHVIKLFTPLFPEDFRAERTALPAVLGRLGVATPEIVAEGELAGWPYLVLVRVRGRLLGPAWEGLSAKERQHVARQIGMLIAALRAVPTAGLEALGLDWPAFLAEQAASAAARQRAGGLPEALVRQIPAYLESAPPLYTPGFRPVLLHADLTDEHFLITRRRGRLTGVLDFGDAMLGHADYELVAPGLSVAAGDPAVLGELLGAVGYSAAGGSDQLRHRLMAYTLLHRFVNLREVLDWFPACRGMADLRQVAAVLWPVG